MAQPVFKQYSPTQSFLIFPSFDELIEANHPVRVVNDVVDKIDLKLLMKQYKGGGTSSYHPKMMLKVMVYSYLTNTYSSRKMEGALKENIHFMWLSAMNRPDHHTLNSFRGHRLKDTLKDIFVQIVQLLAGEGLISLKEVYADGTKIESASNRYTFVWGNSIKANKEKIKKQIDGLWQYAQKVAAEELDTPEPPCFDKVDAQKVTETIEKIEAALKDKQITKQVKQKLSYAKKNWPANLEKYEVQEQIMGERNSYSKTDHDATFMRMKEDHMLNGQLKPAYNVQISSSDQYVVDYGIHQAPTDTTTFIPHLEQHKEQYGQYPEAVTADAGYGSEQNLQYLEENNIGGYVKYSYFDKEQSSAHLNKYPFAPATLHYNKESDCYYCPMGQPMKNIGTYTKTTAAGFKQELTKYQAANCERCPLNGACHKSKGNRIIEINFNLNRLKAIAHQNLTSEKGVAHRKKRPWDVESVFGNIKSNHGFRRFLLRGKKKVAIEIGLLSIAQNLRKKTA
ncbi:MAG: IS1182 family transposase [Ferruginibacter sp.]